MPNKYINLLTDFGFKFIFGNENNKDLLMDFLNSVMAFQNVHIQNITYKNTEILGQNDEERRAVIDLYCTNEKEEHFIIEVQRATQKYFKKRVIFYMSRLIQEQGIKNSDWDYNFKGVYCIAILERSLFSNSEIIQTYRILNEKTYEKYLDDIGIIFINLDQFHKKQDELETNFDKWLYLLKNLHRLKGIPIRLQKNYLLGYLI